MSIDCLDCFYICGTHIFYFFFIKWNINIESVSVHMGMNQ